MKFLIDGSASRIAKRIEQSPDAVAGQLLTPLTRYRSAGGAFAIDNGAYSQLDIRALQTLAVREAPRLRNCLFLVVPDRVGSHKETLQLWDQYADLFCIYPRAFVAQDGFTSLPDAASAIFIGGTDRFKNSKEALAIVTHYASQGLHVHVGRVNGADRFFRYSQAGAHTCDGSGVSRFDHMLVEIRRRLEGTPRNKRQQKLW